MRGKVAIIEKSDKVFRITPAYAGKSSTQFRPEKALKDHPRLCGEKPSVISDNDFLPGSPPPMRGKVVKNATCQNHTRITPAYAGKSKH